MNSKYRRMGTRKERRQDKQQLEKETEEVIEEISFNSSALWEQAVNHVLSKDQSLHQE